MNAACGTTLKSEAVFHSQAVISDLPVTGSELGFHVDGNLADLLFGLPDYRLATRLWQFSPDGWSAIRRKRQFKVLRSNRRFFAALRMTARMEKALWIGDDERLVGQPQV
jgi:hypothetical protein